MIIIRNIADYIVYSEDAISNALRKVEKNNSGLVFLVNHHDELDGVLTDGDFRRWVLEQETPDLNIRVCEISREDFTSVKEGESPDKVRALFSEAIKLIPIVDKNNHLVAIAKGDSSSIQIGGHIISSMSPAFVIAEIGINHNGSLDSAKQLVDEAVLAGADCAKFQMRHLKEIYQNEGNPNDPSEDLGSQYILDVISRSQLSVDEMCELFDYCREKSILPLCTPWDISSVNVLEEYGIDGYKVASADLTNHDLIEAIARTGKPMILSTGMSHELEITETVDLLKRQGAPYILLNCNSTYPAPFKDLNLQYLDRLKEIGDCLVGYSGHERGLNIALAAVACGAKVIEKHFTLDKNLEGNDHKVSLLPKEFRSMVEGIRQIEEAMGTSSERIVGPGERMNRENLAKSLVANCDIGLGDVITEDMIQVKGPGKGLQPNKREELIGITARRKIKSGEFFYPMDLGKGMVVPRDYKFKRPWGLPVRYHDFDILQKKTNVDFLEFHLSYKDMDQEVESFFPEAYDVDFAVHSPDLFPGDHLLNLAEKDESSRKRSVAELQRVIEIARRLKPFFKKTDRVPLIVSVGGFSKDRPISREYRGILYDRVAKSLSELDTDGVEILPQTLPPFPWYFGGQLYCNIFVDAEDTVKFCQDHGYRVCLDVSHSQLAVNHRKSSFTEFVDLVGPYTGHLHLVDAEGLDGEGVQIGDGEINFAALSDQLARFAPHAGFIPEIWQGHKNEGEGFWLALERLEQWF
jgi:N-acetylneuraminate synthase